MSINHNFLREGRAEADRTEVLLLTSLVPYRYATPAHKPAAAVGEIWGGS